MEHSCQSERHALSILQYWLEKCLDELAQFKATLQFRGAHQPGKPTVNKLHPRSTARSAQTQKSREKLPTSWSVFFLDKERWCLGEDILRVHEQAWLASKDSFSAWPKQWELVPQTRCSLIANKTWDTQGESNEDVWSRLQGGNDLGEATDNDRYQRGYQGTFTLAQGWRKWAIGKQHW
jgi:hypothetical protein